MWLHRDSIRCQNNQDREMTLNPADDSFARLLQQTLPADMLRPAEPRHLEEPRGHWSGISGWCAMPRNTQEVAQIVRACADARVGVVPFGGGTGLVGGQVAKKGPPPLILSLERMKAIRSISPADYSVEVEAGVILADLRAATEDKNRLFPLSLASEGSARIGGLLATNAGGINTLRYGNARDLVLGIEAVLPDGSVFNGLKRLRKDNTGYDLRHLLIGAEGTLGVITAATLKLSPLPAQRATALLSVPGPAAALELLSMARETLGEAVAAFELLSRTGFDFLAQALPDLRQPWTDEPPLWSVLIELETGPEAQPQAALETLFAKAFEKGLVSDGLVAQSQTQRLDFWNMREHIPVANKLVGAISSHDISVPLDLIPEFITRANQALAALGDWRINCFGHMGDGNLHYNVFLPSDQSRQQHAHRREEIKTCVHDLVHDLSGSVSAEHGIGRLKTSDLSRYGDPVKLSAMRAIKTALDPVGIMNPGAMLAD